MDVYINNLNKNFIKLVPFVLCSSFNDTEVDKKKIEIFDLFLKILKDLKTYDTIKWLN